MCFYFFLYVYLIDEVDDVGLWHTQMHLIRTECSQLQKRKGEIKLEKTIKIEKKDALEFRNQLERRKGTQKMSDIASE